MSIIGDIKKDIREAKKVHLSWHALANVCIFAFWISWLSDRWNRLDLAMPLMINLFTLGFVIMLKRDLWPYRWFWISLGFLALVLMAIVLSIHWTEKWIPASVYAGAGSLELVVILAIISVLKIVLKNKNFDDTA